MLSGYKDDNNPRTFIRYYAHNQVPKTTHSPVGEKSGLEESKTARMNHQSMPKRLPPLVRRTSTDVDGAMVTLAQSSCCRRDDKAPAVTANSRLDDQTATTHSELSSSSSWVAIEDWHAVLGDKHCSNRSTTATQILKNVKKEFKKKYTGKHRKAWYAEAIDRYHELVKKEFPHVPDTVRGQVLVQCTPQVLESDRVVEPFTHGYQGKEAIYGLAKVPEAIHFFFNSRDSPDLEQEVRKLRSKWTDLGQNTTKRPPQAMMDEFDDLLSFVERKLQSPDENVMATEILKGIKFIPVLQRSWKLLIQNMQPVVATMDAVAAVSSTNGWGDQALGNATEANDDFDDRLAQMGPLIALGDEVAFKDLIEFSNDYEQRHVDAGIAVSESTIMEDTKERLILADLAIEPTSLAEEKDMSVIAEFQEKANINDTDTGTGELTCLQGTPRERNEYIDASTERDGHDQNGQVAVESPGDEEKEVVIETLRQEQLALKSQIYHLNGLMRTLLRNSGEMYFGSKADELSFLDDHSSILIPGEGHPECGSVCSSQASGRKRARRSARRSSARSHSRSLSVSSKRSRNDRQDGESRASDQIPLEIEMLCHAQEYHDVDADSCESYESGEIEFANEMGKNSQISNVSKSQRKPRSLGSRSPRSSVTRSETEIGSVSTEEPDESSNVVKVEHVSNIRIGRFGRNSGLYSGMISVCTGMPHGWGRMALQTPGAFYDGEWRHGKYEGLGRLVQKGETYDGGFRKGKKHGPGTMKTADGTLWNGVFANGEMVQGTKTFADGRKFEGVFAHKRIVHGVVTDLDGSHYSGQWLDGLPHGNGTKIFPDGARYEGDFRKGLMSGPGKIFRPDGSVYEGGYMDLAITEFRSETSPYGIFNYDGLFRDGNGKEGRRILRRVRDAAKQHSNHVESLRGLQKRNIPPRRPGEKVLSQGFREGHMPGFSKKFTEDGFLYVVDEGESSGSDKSVTGEETNTQKAETQQVATEATPGRDGRFSRMVGSAKSLRRNLKLSRGRSLRDNASKRSTFTA